MKRKNKLSLLALILVICLFLPVLSACDSWRETELGKDKFNPKTRVPMIISMDRFNELILKPIYEKYGDELYSDDPSSEIFEIQKNSRILCSILKENWT